MLEKEEGIKEQGTPIQSNISAKTSSVKELIMLCDNSLRMIEGKEW